MSQQSTAHFRIGPRDQWRGQKVRAAVVRQHRRFQRTEQGAWAMRSTTSGPSRRSYLRRCDPSDVEYTATSQSKFRESHRLRQRRTLMRACTPDAALGFDAYTRYWITYRYSQSVQAHGLCKATSVGVGIHTEILLPAVERGLLDAARAGRPVADLSSQRLRRTSRATSISCSLGARRSSQTLKRCRRPRAGA